MEDTHKKKKKRKVYKIISTLNVCNVPTKNVNLSFRYNKYVYRNLRNNVQNKNVHGNNKSW